MKLPYTITNSGASVLVDNRMRTVPSTGVHFERLRTELRKPVHDVALISELVDLKRFIAKHTLGRVAVGDQEVRFDGVKVGNVVAERILEILHAGEDIEPMALFLANLMLNPLESAQSELFLWLESGNMPITPDGHFIAFKKVRNNYFDIHSGTVRYMPGDTPTMLRSGVDPNRYNECSSGLHFCSWSYLSNFGGGGGGNRVVIVKINPADVVAIPTDYNFAKGRTFTMLVLGEVPEEETQHLFSGRPIYHDTGHVEDAADEDLEESTDEELDDAGDDREFCTSCQDILEDLLTDCVDTGVSADVFKTDDSKQETLPVFSRGNQSFSAAEILELVSEHGQRGFSRLTAVPRSTLQEWLTKIREVSAG